MDFQSVAVQFSPDGSIVVAGSSAGALVTYDAHSGEERGRIDLKLGIFSVDFSPDGEKVAVACGGLDPATFEDKGQVAIVDPRTFETVAVHDKLVTGESPSRVSYSLDGRALAVGFSSGGVRLDLASGKIQDFGADFGAVAFLADGSLASIDASGVGLMLPNSSKRYLPIKRETVATRFTVSRDRRILGVDTTMPSVRLFSVEGTPAGGVPITIPTPAVALSSEGRRIALSGSDRVRVIDVASQKEIASFKAASVMALAFSPDDEKLAMGFANAKIAIESVR